MFFNIFKYYAIPSTAAELGCFYCRTYISSSSIINKGSKAPPATIASNKVATPLVTVLLKG
jgi:hypothetical protein